MRNSRMKKLGKKNGKLIFASKILIMWYAILISGIILTSNTVAYYSTSSDVNSYISSAEDWWDKSELKFLDKGAEVIQGCPPAKVSVEIENIGLSMSQPTEFEIYYSENNGKPSKNGEIISNGLIDPMEQNEISVLDYETEKEGWYIFKVYQRPGFKGNYDNRQEIWSNKVRLHCSEQQNNLENNTEEKSEVENNEIAPDVKVEDVNTQNNSKKENNEEVIEEKINESNEPKSNEETNDNGTNTDTTNNNKQKKTNQADIQPEMPKEKIAENNEIKSEVEKESGVNSDSK